MNSQIVVYPNKVAWTQMVAHIAHQLDPKSTVDDAIEALRKKKTKDNGYQDTLSNLIQDFPFLFITPEKSFKAAYFGLIDEISEISLSVSTPKT